MGSILPVIQNPRLLPCPKINTHAKFRVDWYLIVTCSPFQPIDKNYDTSRNYGPKFAWRFLLLHHPAKFRAISVTCNVQIRGARSAQLGEIRRFIYNILYPGPIFFGPIKLIHVWCHKGPQEVFPKNPHLVTESSLKNQLLVV